MLDIIYCFASHILYSLYFIVLKSFPEKKIDNIISQVCGISKGTWLNWLGQVSFTNLQMNQILSLHAIFNCRQLILSCCGRHATEDHFQSKRISEFLTISYEIFFNGFQMKLWEFLTFSWEQYMVSYLTKYLSTMKAKKFDQLDMVLSI